MKEMNVFNGQDEYSGFCGFWRGWYELYNLYKPYKFLVNICLCVLSFFLFTDLISFLIFFAGCSLFMLYPYHLLYNIACTDKHLKTPQKITIGFWEITLKVNLPKLMHQLPPSLHGNRNMQKEMSEARQVMEDLKKGKAIRALKVLLLEKKLKRLYQRNN